MQSGRRRPNCHTQDIRNMFLRSCLHEQTAASFLIHFTGARATRHNTLGARATHLNTLGARATHHNTLVGARATHHNTLWEHELPIQNVSFTVDILPLQ